MEKKPNALTKSKLQSRNVPQFIAMHMIRKCIQKGCDILSVKTEAMLSKFANIFTNTQIHQKKELNYIIFIETLMLKQLNSYSLHFDVRPAAKWGTVEVRISDAATNLEELAADCASDGVHEFLLAAPPLPVTGAVGAPVAPIAVK